MAVDTIRLLGFLSNVVPIFQLNGNLVFRCNSQHSLSLMFSCQKELARFSVGPVPGAIESKPGDENVSGPCTPKIDFRSTH